MSAEALQARTWRLLELLADGEFHSGEALAREINVSRASVFSALEGVAECGVELQRIRGRGYRLAHSWERLERGEIMRWLDDDAHPFDVEVLLQAASSNALLLHRAGQGAASGSVLAVELQTAGRGRLGRAWHSGLGNALTFSLLWRFGCGLNALSGLSLAVGVAIMRALDNFGAQGVRLKWPNDVLTEQGKLAGVLVEAQGDMLGPSAVVIGIGLNCTLPSRVERRIDQPAGALEEACRDLPPRNRLLAALLRELANVLQQFEQSGFAGLRGEWERYHAHQDLPLQLRLPDGRMVEGVARGVSDSGELCVETAQGLHRFNSGEVGRA